MSTGIPNVTEQRVAGQSNRNVHHESDPYDNTLLFLNTKVSIPKKSSKKIVPFKGSVTTLFTGHRLFEIRSYFAFRLSPLKSYYITVTLVPNSTRTTTR